MQVLLAENYGFCPGVKNAINMAEKTLEDKEKIYSLGPIIHNNDVVQELAEKGLVTVNSLEDINSGTVLIRSHGATREQLDMIRKKGLTIVDATCVLVKRLQKISNALREEGCEVVIIGDKDHPEVQAVVGSADGVTVIGCKEDINNLSRDKKLGIICQTTQSPEYFSSLVAGIVEHGFMEIKVINTLCREAIKRQKAAVELCRKVDVMFVLGGLHSANTKKLAQLCKKYNNRTFHLQNRDELDKTMVSDVSVAGVTAGASTPENVIAEFVKELGSY